MNLPNKLTIARIISVPFFIAAYMFGYYILAFVLFIAASFTDMLDGKIARKYNLVTNFGKIMDPLADKILVYSAFCLMVEDGTVPGWMLIVILAREFAIAGMRTVAASDGTVIAAGMSGKIKTVLQMIAVPLLLLTAAIDDLDVFYYINLAAQIFLWASLIMTVYSGIEYIAKNKKCLCSIGEVKMKTAILSVGTEVLFGQIINTNTVYLSQQLNLLGFDVMYHYTVGDNSCRLSEMIELAFRDCDFIITTGGLGPTEDDLTKETVCETLHDQLVMHEPSLQALHEIAKNAAER